MRELGGLDYAQISEALESSPAVARQTVYEARLGLRELETGREMSCERVMRQLSEADGRVRRRRDVRAHLRSCPDCRAFRDSIDERRGDLAALTPLPAVAAASILHGLIGGGKIAAGSGLGGAATAAGAGAGKAAGTSLAVKTVATVAVAATVGVTAADRAGLVNVGLPGDKGNGVVKESRTPDRGEGAFGPASAQGETNAAERGRGAALRAAARAKRRRADAIPGSGAGAAPTGSSNPTQLPAGENHDGVPTASPAGSNYGRETSAAHKATNKGKAKGKSKPHPKPSPHSNGSQGKGKNNPGPGGEASGKGGGTSKAHGSPPTGSTPQDDHPAQTEPSGQAKKSEAPTEPIEASGKGAGDESEPSP
ncbi:MAG TPA: hypothetical protein VJQ84_08445, partial [Solirubrobacterales bacterium]|nr:hypothetical protein [Solirubrobacterales bacterium]